jgi:hypothetical protein
MAPAGFDMDRLGPFRILRALDSESAVKFVAREEGPAGFCRDVVLKIVPEKDSAHAVAAGQLAREATLGSRLNHPNIVRTHDFFAQDGRLVLVLEHVDGTTLAHLLAALRARQERLSDQAAIYIGVAVLEALAHAHAQVDAAGARAPIFHLRVAPAAILLGRDGTVRLGEFSAAPGDEPPSPDDPLASPSRATPEEGDKADVRAAGLLLWELLTGRETTGPIEPLAMVRSDLPRELTAAVGAALDAHGAKRTVGCAEVANWIKKVARVSGGRNEVRQRVTLLIPPLEPEPPAAEPAGESGRIPLQGWTVRLAPIANKVLSVAEGLPKAGAIVRRSLSVVRSAIATRLPKADALLRNHPRASLAIGSGVAVTLVLLVIGRSTAHEMANTAPTLAVAPMPTRAAIDPPTADPPALLAAAPLPSPETAQVVAQSPEPTAKIAVAAPGSTPKSPPPPPKGFGYLTVRSSIRYASVYVQLVRYGQVERRLTVRCGKRFLSLGNPKPTGGEPTWFAPSRTVDIPCGGAVEISMMPRWIP